MPFRLPGVHSRRIDAVTSRLPLLSTGVDLLDDSQLLSWLLRSEQRVTVTNHNLHSLALTEKDPRLQEFYRSADVVFIDGMPLVWVLRARGFPARPHHRITALDWLPRFFEKAAGKGVRVFHLGGTTHVERFCRTELPKHFPGLRIDAHHGFFNAEPGSVDNDAIVDQINKYEPDVLLVGMGMPRQEHWVANNRSALKARCVCTIGGTMSYLVGEQATPPRWLGTHGMEGIYRLLHDPRRLGGRYLYEPMGLVGPLARDLLGARRAGRRR